MCASALGLSVTPITPLYHKDGGLFVAREPSSGLKRVCLDSVMQALPVVRNYLSPVLLFSMELYRACRLERHSKPRHQPMNSSAWGRIMAWLFALVEPFEALPDASGAGHSWVVQPGDE